MSGSGLLDVILVVLLVWQFASGWRRGLVGTVLSVAGLVLGAAVTVLILPAIPIGQGLLTEPLIRVLFTVALLLTLTTIGYRLGALAGEGLRSPGSRAGFAPGTASRVLTTVGAVLGGLLAVAVTSVLVWALAVSVRGTAGSVITSAVDRSAVLRSIDTVVPDGTTRLFVPLQRALAQQGFPRVFDGIGLERILDVQPPDAADIDATAVRTASRSIVKITATSQQCGTAEEGSGWVVTDGFVVTNAHVVAGSDSLRVENATGRSWPGRVVRFDPGRDVAVIHVDGLPLSALSRGAPAGRGDPAVIGGYPQNGPLRLDVARVREELTARGGDIYGAPGVSREIYAVRGRVVPGNSGGPLLDASGKVIGVVFATSTDHPDTGYALTMAEVEPVVTGLTGAQDTAPVSTGRCAA